jgi:choline dehydrogenase-like flavoprotein
MPFQNNCANLVSQWSESHTRLIRDYDGPHPDFDYIVIGSGIGGGTVADDLSERNREKLILVVDAGSFVYPTHAYNISRIPNGDMAVHSGADNFLQTETPQQFIGGKP